MRLREQNSAQTEQSAVLGDVVRVEQAVNREIDEPGAATPVRPFIKRAPG